MRVGRVAKQLVLRDKLRRPMVEVTGYWAGVAGLWITELLEEPGVWTVTHHPSGLRLGGRFTDVDTAIDALHSFDNGSVTKVHWAKIWKELVKDVKAEIWMRAFRANYL